MHVSKCMPLSARLHLQLPSLNLILLGDLVQVILDLVVRQHAKVALPSHHSHLNVGRFQVLRQHQLQAVDRFLDSVLLAGLALI